jgi:hypothetical protein
MYIDLSCYALQSFVTQQWIINTKYFVANALFQALFEPLKCANFSLVSKIKLNIDK